MPVFEYQGLNQAGKTIRGMREADSPKSLRSVLRKEGVFLTEVSGTKQDIAAAKRDVDIRKFTTGRISSDDIAIMTRQLATLIGAGIPLVEGLTALVEQVDHAKLKRIVGEIKTRVNEGASLADAMAQHGIFSALYVNMIRAGEHSGALDVVLNRLADFTESQARLRSKILGTMAYPAAMAVFSVVVIGILFTVVIPKVTQIFEDMEVTLPIMTRMLIFMSEVAKDWWWAILAASAGTVFGARAWLKTKTGKATFDTWMLRMPIFGSLVRMLAISRFSKTLATLLKSGVPLLTAMDIVRAVVDNTVIARVIEEARESIREGESVAAPLKRSGEFPPLVHHMIAIGERSGQLEEMLSKIADAYDAQIDTRIGAMTSLLEPIMIVLMGGGVAFVVFSILMPILQMNTFVRG